MLARPSLDAGDLAADITDDVGQLRDDLMLLAEELQQQRTAQVEMNERVDFLERVLAQLRDERNRGHV